MEEHELVYVSNSLLGNKAKIKLSQLLKDNGYPNTIVNILHEDEIDEIVIKTSINSKEKEYLETIENLVKKAGGKPTFCSDSRI